MSPAEMAKHAAVCRAARLIVDALEAFPAAEIEHTIAFREATESTLLTPYSDEAALRAGRALTATLKMILFFRSELLAIQANDDDQAACIEHARQRLAAASPFMHECVVKACSEPGGEAIREFLEGAAAEVMPPVPPRGRSV